MYIVNDDIPLGCVYEGENGKTKYCPMLNHDDVPYCQYLEDDEAAIGIDERPVYCPIVELPSADVQPVQHGRWEKDPRSKRTRCSECYSVVPRDDYRRECLSDYCSVCGAKMMKYTGMKGVNE